MALTASQIVTLSTPRLLGKIAEESSEVIKAAMKHQTYGARPQRDGVQYNNVRDVSDEFSELALLIQEYRNRFGRC